MTQEAGKTTSDAPLVLIAEDDRALRASLVRAFELEGYRVQAVANGAEAIGAMTAVPENRAAPDVIVLDLMMPVLDGLSTCRRLRARGDRTPIIILTARNEVPDRISGLDAGADDYLAKPFVLDELLARVRALLRRVGSGDRNLVVADLRVDPAARRAFRGNRELELSKTEFDLLELLARETGLVLTASTVYERIWGYDFGPDSKNLAVYIGYLRRKTEATGELRLIHTVRGVGYTLRPGRLG